MTNADSLPESRFLPLKPNVFMVLLALQEGPSHGYGIRKEVLERSEGTVELDPSGLYRLIARLESDGLLRASRARPPEEQDDERRNYYELTPVGRRVLAAEARRLARLMGRPDMAAVLAAGASGGETLP